MNKYYLFFLLPLIYFTGCVTPQKNIVVEPQKIYKTFQKVEDKPQDLHTLYLDYYLDEERNKVLNLMKLGLYSYQKGYYKEAEFAFDRVLNNIESLNLNSEMSDQAKSLWHGENSKLFVGEPYERSMAYFYRGLLYLKSGDYENARASFKGGILQDSRSENEDYQADFKSLILLEALSSKLNGEDDLYKESINEFLSIPNSINDDPLSVYDDPYLDTENNNTKYVPAWSDQECRNQNMNPVKHYLDGSVLCGTTTTSALKSSTTASYSSNSSTAELDTDTIKGNKELIVTDQSNNDKLELFNSSNLFILIDTGRSPEKYASGEQNEELKFREGNTHIQPSVTVGGKEQKKAILIDDLYFQASTRGGRLIDKIIDGKVEFKEDYHETGEALKEGGAAALYASAMVGLSSNDENAQLAAGAVALVAVSAMAVGAIFDTVSDAVKTEVDTRYWDNLPGAIYLYTDKLDIGKYTIDIQAETQKTITVNIEENKISVIHITPNIIKPSGLITNTMIENVLVDKDKYKQNPKENNNEKVNNWYDNTLNSIKSSF